MQLLKTQMDRVRGNYQLKEQKLAQALAQACGVDRHHPKYEDVIKWKTKHTDKHAGNFVQYMYNVSWLLVLLARLGLR